MLSSIQKASSIFIALFLLCVSGYAQKPLTPSKQSSYYTYIYKLDDADMLIYYEQLDKAPIEKLLHTLVDSFKTDINWKNNLPRGNYIKVYAEKNKLQYQLIENHTASLQLLRNNYDLNFILTDRIGKEIHDALAEVKTHVIAFDPKSNSYHASINAKNQLLRVDYEGTANFYLLQKTGYFGPSFLSKRWFRYKWDKVKKIFSHDDNDYSYRNQIRENLNSLYTGFMVFNKPKYKPRDTVKFKAFALYKNSRKPVNAAEVIVRIKKNFDDNGTIIGTVKAYRAGAYSYEFVLADSLKLSLDDDYTVTIEDLSSKKYDLDKYKGDNDEKFLLKRKVYATGQFMYEDYELKTIKFNLRADKAEHEPGSPVSIYLKATDENDLPITDGRVTLRLTISYIKDYASPNVFVPDTLWVHKLKLDPIGETKVMIPDSIFPKASFNYTIVADLLNSDNERSFQDKTIIYNYRTSKIITALSHDTLKANYQYLGKERKIAGILKTINKDGDTIATVPVTLPLSLVINPDIKGYFIKTDSASEFASLERFDNGFNFSGYRTSDSVFIHFNNPRKIPIWYWVYDGGSLVDAGKADSLFYKRRFTNHHSQLAFIVNYVWAGVSKWNGQDIQYQDKLLKVNVTQPISVYPGQKATTIIEVKDIDGHPVAGADLTAWSFTKKFDEYKTPFVPYLGKEYHSKTKTYLNQKIVYKSGMIALNWQKYSRQMGLDSITYYQFTHPTSTFSVEEAAPDSITQIAPFAVKNGEIIPVAIAYIDEKPVYFSEAKQYNRYSFVVKPGLHNIRLRTDDELVSLKDINAEKGKKLIISVNLDTMVNKTSRFIKMPDTLTAYEANLMSKYMIKVEPNFGTKLATIEQDGRIFLLNPNYDGYNGYTNTEEILTGPISNDMANFGLRGQFYTPFFAESGYTYLFQPSFLKQRSIPGKYPFHTYLLLYRQAPPDYTQYSLTWKNVDSVWQSYLDLRSNTTPLFVNEPITDAVTGKLLIKIDTGKDGKLPFIKNVIIYRNGYPDFIMVYPGKDIDLGNLAPGKYRLFFLLKGDRYFVKNDVVIKPNGTNFYLVKIDPQPADSVSVQINDIIMDRPGSYKSDDGEISNDALKLKETFNEKYLNDDGFTNTIRGRVRDNDDKQPIIGATVKIKGSNRGVMTDVNGLFAMKGPISGKLVISYIGYMAKEINIHPGEYEDIWLEPTHSALNEVVVTGYTTQRRKDITGAVSVVTSQELRGQVSGLTVTLRGNRSMTDNVEPLIIVDGVQIENMNGIDASMIQEMSTLKGAAAKAIYGTRAANGVVIITTKKNNINGATEPLQGGNPGNLRKNFSDYAYWQPKLTTDAQGMATFTTTFPDDITNWRTFVIAVNDQRQTGFMESQIKSFKPVSANFLSPQFAVAGDKMNVIGKVLNYTTNPVKVNRKFSFNGNIIKGDSLLVKNSKIDTLSITTGNTDSLTFEYTIDRSNGFFDGERRKIPVIQQGVEETVGVFGALNRDTTLTMKFDPAMGPVTFRAEASVLPALTEEASRLRNYKYLCNEQLASKLIGLLSEKRIKHFLNQPFANEKNIPEVIKKLQQNRRSQGTWGWWKDTDEELWVSLHAIGALLNAQKEGYAIELDKQKLTEYLVYQLESYNGQDKLICLQLLRKLDVKVDYQKYVAVIDKENLSHKEVSKYDRFKLMLLKQEVGLQVEMDSLLTTVKHTMFGNIYWGENNYHFFDNSIQLSVLAYHILRNEGKHPDMLMKIRGYFLEQRKDGGWRNTYESALILETILPDLLIQDTQIKPASIILSGAKNETVNKFPYSATFSGAELNISKTGTSPVYITGYQQFWNKQPKKVNKDFTVDTWFEQNDKKLTRLKGGEPVLLKAEVTVKGDADYVMINIPIPAGCSYENKEQPWENEVHREYFKDRVSIFSRKLKHGKYTFTVKLLPRYDGVYNLNPAKAEMMYFPIFYGREGMKVVSIGQ